MRHAVKQRLACDQYVRRDDTFINKMSNEIHFVQEIEKRECLYNFNIPEYNRKQSDLAWSEVARNTNLTVNECKEKWRNIRSSFLRSMKKSEKIKKPYYLSPYLQFVVPFTKLSQSELLDELQRGDCNTSEENEVDIKISSVKSEQNLLEGQNPFESVDIDAVETDVSSERATADHNSLNSFSASLHRKRRRALISRNHDELRVGFKKKQSANPSSAQLNDSSHLNNSSMRYFLLSLLPDFETMTDDQIRTFKIKVMMLIDNIKTNFSEVRDDMNCTKETKRLQKRLINLLLKNLQRNS